jgi:YesN/AraC family two-component response regulator
MSKILLVDDDAQVRKMLKITLERAGYEVVEAADGVQAVQVYSPDTIDLVITDIVMPEKEGIETIMELKTAHPEVRIIAISGGGRINPEDYLKWAQRFGVARTFTKPVDREELLTAVSELLDTVGADG